MEEDLPPRPDFLPPGFGTVGHKDFVEIVVPPGVRFTPVTVAWYVLFVAVTALVVFVALRALQRYRHNAYRRAALAELAELEKAAGGSERDAALARVPGLLKRCALSAFARETVAGLSGDRWLAFLERTAPGAMNDAAKSALQTLVIRDASALPKTEATALFEGVERWMRGHRA